MVLATLSRAMTLPEPQSRRAPLRSHLRPTVGPAAEDVGIVAKQRHPLATCEEKRVEGGEGERASGAVGQREASAAREGRGYALWVPAAEHEPAADQLAALPAKVQMALRTKRDARVERVAGDGREKKSRPKCAGQARRSHRQRRPQSDDEGAEPTPHACGWLGAGPKGR